VASKLSLFLAELKRRKVVRVAAVYVLVGLGVIEGAQMILPTLQLEAAYDYIVIFVLFGFPVALVLAWALEVTPQGIQKTADLTPEQLASHTPAKWRASSWVLAGVGLVAVLGAGYFVFFRGEADSLFPEDYVAVFPFENRTGDPNLGDLGWYVAHSIADGLGRIPEVRQVAPNHVEDVLLAQAEGISTLETAKSLRVGMAVSGGIARIGDQLEFRAQITRVADGELLQSIVEMGNAEDPGPGVGALAERVMGTLAVLMDEVYQGQLFRPVSYEAFLSFRRGGERFAAGDYPGAVAEWEDACRQDSTNFLSAISLFSAYQLTGQDQKRDSIRVWLDSRRLDMNSGERTAWDLFVAASEGNIESQLAVLRAEAQRDPAAYAVALAPFAVSVGRAEEALEALDQVDLDGTILRDQPGLWTVAPLANHLLGRYEEELEAARRGRERFPEFLALRRYEIQALVALNRLDEIGPLLDQVWEMEPDDYGWSPGGVFRAAAGALARFGHAERSEAVAERSLNWYLARDPEWYRRGRAQTLILVDRASEALTLLGPLVEASPEDVRRRGLYGIALASTRDQEGAEAEAKWLEELDSPYLAGSNTFFRGAIAAHLDRGEAAVRLLRQALQEGLSFETLSNDSYLLRPLWGYQPFEQLISPKG
jgi:tetratricopeptide (TPR) repeat protein